MAAIGPLYSTLGKQFVCFTFGTAKAPKARARKSLPEARKSLSEKGCEAGCSQQKAVSRTCMVLDAQRRNSSAFAPTLHLWTNLQQRDRQR